MTTPRPFSPSIGLVSVVYKNSPNRHLIAFKAAQFAWTGSLMSLPKPGGHQKEGVSHWWTQVRSTQVPFKLSAHMCSLWSSVHLFIVRIFSFKILELQAVFLYSAHQFPPNKKFPFLAPVPGLLSGRGASELTLVLSSDICIQLLTPCAF